VRLTFISKGLKVDTDREHVTAYDKREARYRTKIV